MLLCLRSTDQGEVGVVRTRNSAVETISGGGAGADRQRVYEDAPSVLGAGAASRYLKRTQPRLACYVWRQFTLPVVLTHLRITLPGIVMPIQS